jgi:hypothetical protein
MTVSDAPSCGITYDFHSDESRDVNYNHNILHMGSKSLKYLKPIKANNSQNSQNFYCCKFYNHEVNKHSKMHTTSEYLTTFITIQGLKLQL